jgi:hypothetical protein
MANVYEGQPDARQGDDPAPTPTLFRKRYKALSPDELALHDAIKDKADELAVLFAKVNRNSPAGRDYDPSRTEDMMFIDGISENRVANVMLALRHLEDAVYRAVKALTA